MVGLLGSSLVVRVNGSSDDTDDDVSTRTEIWIEFQEAPDVSNLAFIKAEYEFREVEEEVFDVEDEFGISGLHIEWSTRPYATLGDVSDAQFVDDDPLVEGLAGDDGDAVTVKWLIEPHAHETRQFILQDLKMPVNIAVGLQNRIWGWSDDYTYSVRFHSHWVLNKVSVEFQ